MIIRCYIVFTEFHFLFNPIIKNIFMDYDIEYNIIKTFKGDWIVVQAKDIAQVLQHLTDDERITMVEMI